MRILEIDAVYEEAWDLLHVSDAEVPVRVPDRILHGGASDVGWPEHHPGLLARN